MTIKTHLSWGRELTSAEQSAMENRKQKLINSGFVYGPGMIENNVTIREWSCLEDANDFLSFVNAFTPPPVIATLVTE